jgi:threonine/homoserine/homoserine lactone efflux protein
MSIFFSSLLFGYTGAMMPGPLLTYSIERSLHRGWKKGLLVPLGHIVFELVLVVLIVLGMGAFLNLPWPQIVILFVGGVMLLFFGADMIKSAVKGTLQLAVKDGAPPKRGENLEILVKSGLISVMNPYFLVWWASIGLGGFLLAHSTLGIGGVVLFYTGHALADISWYLAVSLLCDRIGRFIAGKPYDKNAVSGLPLRRRIAIWIRCNPYRAVIGALGAALVYFAIKFIIKGIWMLEGIL